jgi:quinol monooxygenase YgiN
MIVIEVVFEAFADAQDHFVGLMRQTTAATQLEKGCVLYRFAGDLEHPNRFYLTEIWQTEEDLKAHFTGNAFKNFFSELPTLGRFVSDMALQGPLAHYVPPNARR